MKKFLLELRRREVFRTAGLYIGIGWILIEAASVVGPIFDVPDWVLQSLVIAVMVGFPVMLVLAWVYDVSDKGLVVQADATDTVVIPFGGRKADFSVIGVLVVALTFSVYMNLTSGPELVEELDTVSILIADFDNQTGDPLFEGALEQALQIGVEGAPFVSGYQRGIARKLAMELQETDKLNSEVAQLVAVREGITLVIAGSIVPDGNRYDLAIDVLDPRTGEVVIELHTTSPSKLEVMAAIGGLAADLREELGDKSLDRDALEVTETFTAMSLDAAREYDKGQQLQYAANYEQAIEHYRSAIEHDPGFGRAYSGWAVAARNLGLLDEATEAWEQAMANLGTMTERERLRTQGIYYWGVTRNFQKAIETYETLVDKYPADYVGRNNLAVVKFFDLDFDGARIEGGRAVEIYPSNAISQSNYALYAMYSSDFDTAVTEAEKARDLDPKFFAVWLPLAMRALSDNDLDAARSIYQSMSAAGSRGASTASLGLADVEMFAGNYGSARTILTDGIAADEIGGNNYFLAVKYLALAEALLAQGEKSAALDAVAEGLARTGGNAAVVPAALIYIAAGEADKALELADSLSQKLPPQPRAYAALIEALATLETGEYVQAIEQLTGAIEIADLWLLRYHLGRAYFDAGYYVEALDEFTAASDRHGEATAVFLDDLPTYRFMATLPYWQGRAQAELGMTDTAAENFARFIAGRPGGGPLADDARQRLP